jgi:hypothetical protein
MEMTVERYESRGVEDPKTKQITITGEHKVGKTETFNFGGPDDHITAAVGGGYTLQWNPDFLQKSSLGRNNPFARFYFDKKIAVDVDDPESHVAKQKRNLLFENGFGYLCIPPNFPQDYAKVKGLCLAAVSEYNAYDKLHPRPEVYQEVVLPAEGNLPARKVRIRSIDLKVGGGLTISPEQQPVLADQETRALTKAELDVAHEQRRVMKAIRDCAKRGQPFRNPFIKKGGIRLYNIAYKTDA